MWLTMALKVIVRCSRSDIAFQGSWPEGTDPEAVLRDYAEKARAHGVPIHLEVKGHGAWKIAPSGKVAREIRFLRSRR